MSIAAAPGDGVNCRRPVGHVRRGGVMMTVAVGIAAHQAARAKLALADCEADEPVYEAAVHVEETAARALAETPCASDDEFFAAAASILARDLHDQATLEHYERYGSLAILLANYLEKRAARTGA